jgi:hypothetical protein
MMQQKMKDLQLIPENSNIPTFMRTLPLALLACGGVCCVGANSVRSHWHNHGAAKTLAAACLAYAGWQGFKAARKRSSSSDIWQRCDPLLSIAGGWRRGASRDCAIVHSACSDLRHCQGGGGGGAQNLGGARLMRQNVQRSAKGSMMWNDAR